jgi:hypothetical protein
MRLTCCVSPVTIVKTEEKAVVRQRLDKEIPATTNTHATIEELLDAVVYMRYVSYQIGT